MCNFNVKGVLSNCDEIFNLLFILETLIKFTIDSCNNKLCINDQCTPETLQDDINAERNDYINMLLIIQEKINKLKEISLEIESDLSS